MDIKCTVLVIGSGPAGLSAAISSACDGFDTIVVEANSQPGGQAGLASRIENLVGQDNITGSELILKATAQANKFGVDFIYNFKTIDLERSGEAWRVTCADGDSITADAVVVATGVKFNRLEAENLGSFIGRGVYYGSPSLIDDYSGEHIGVVGAGNSSLQAALYTSRHKDTRVTIFVRGDKLTSSWYLRDRVVNQPSIKILYETEISSVIGEHKISHVVTKYHGDSEKIAIDRLYCMIGSSPNTFWLNDKLSLTETGHIKTGYQNIDCQRWASYSPGRLPMPLEALPGVFAAGDVRAGIAKRIASAIGDGAEIVSEIGRYLNGLKK